MLVPTLAMLWIAGAARAGCKNVTLRPPGHRPFTLAAFSGSGGFILREMLEQVTGYKCLSRMEDEARAEEDFPEGIPQALMVEVGARPSAAAPYTRSPCLLLVRNAEDTLMTYAEALYQVGKNPMPMPDEVFRGKPFRYRDQEGMTWSRLVNFNVLEWSQFYLEWLTFGKTTHVVFYELLVHDTENTLTGILKYLKLDFSKEDLKCALSQSYEFYSRRRFNFSLYERETALAVQRKARKVLVQLELFQKMQAAPGWF